MFNLIFNDLGISIILVGIIYFGTKLVNYYYNFYHIYKFLDYEQKLGYFKNYQIITLISKNKFIKRIIIYYILIPLIKITYLLILLLITLLYSLCYNEFKKFIAEQNNNKETCNYLTSETFNEIENNNINIQNEQNELNELNRLNGQNDKYIDIHSLNEITKDCNSSIISIMNFISETNNSNSNPNLDLNLNKINQNIEDDNNNQNEKSELYKLDKLNEQNNNDNNIQSLNKITKDCDDSIISIMNLISEITIPNSKLLSNQNNNDEQDIQKINNNTEPELNLSTELELLKNNNNLNSNSNFNSKYNIDIEKNIDNDTDNDISNFLIDKKENIDKQDYKNLNKYIYLNSNHKEIINDDNIETINVDDIIFCTSIENNTVKENSMIDEKNKNIIRIGKKKK